jgi:hypothetical protein
MALLAESGCRISEIGTLQIKNVTFESGGARIIVHGKTGPRSILIIKSAPYLQIFINNHPSGDDPEAYLWHNGRGKLLTYQRFRDILASAKKKAGITKRIHPHLFRHTAATKMANFMTDNQLKKYMGWTSARMIGIYTHLSGKDTDDAVLKMNGLAVEEKKQDSILENHKCLRCSTINSATNRCCSQCGLIISDEFAKETLIKESQRAEADDLMNTLMKDPEVLEILKRKLHKNVRNIDDIQPQS